MDPNATLRAMRTLAQDVLACEGDQAETAVELAEHVQALDDWLRFKGFMPDAWARGAETRRDIERGPVKCDWGNCGARAVETCSVYGETRAYCGGCADLNRECLRYAATIRRRQAATA